MRRAAVLALGLWVAAATAHAQSMGPGAPPVSDEVRAAVAQSTAGDPARLTALAAAGKPDAQFFAGIFHIFGARGFAKDGAKGCGYVAAASRVRADAMHILGECYQHGYGGEKDLEKAAATFAKAGDMGLAKSRCAEGNILIELGREQARAVKLCQAGAEAGDADAQTDTGNFYLQGRFVAKDVVKARGWYEKAAAQGQGNAAFTLGQIYWNGDGVKRDITRAAELWRLAYEKGRLDASLPLGDEAYVRAKRGDKVWDVDGLEEAASWYEKATQLPDASARETAKARLKLVRDLQGVMARRRS